MIEQKVFFEKKAALEDSILQQVKMFSLETSKSFEISVNVEAVNSYSHGDSNPTATDIKIVEMQSKFK